MAYQSGHSGSVDGATFKVDVTFWELDQLQDQHDSTVMNAGAETARNFVTGLRRYTARTRALIPDDATAHEFRPGAAATLVLQSNTGPDKWTAATASGAVISRALARVDINGIQEMMVDWTISGEMTHTVA